MEDTPTLRKSTLLFILSKRRAVQIKRGVL